MNGVKERFLNYVSVPTQSAEGKNVIPSTEKQRRLANQLGEECKAMGLRDVVVDEHAYVYARIPATSGKKCPILGLIAHMDTSPDCPDDPIKPQLIPNYDGKDIPLPDGSWIRTADYPELSDYKGCELITTDGSTLLGADDKAGVAEIMTLADYLMKHPEIVHGEIAIAFTPDEEVGESTRLFQVERMNANVAYTLDGGGLGEIEYENFNGASAEITVHGFNIHPGSAKGKMKNSILIAMELEQMLPIFEKPMFTEGYEGFYHLNQIEGDVSETKLHYIIRDHDRNKLEEKKGKMEAAIAYLNTKYGADTVTAQINDSYYNMKEQILPHMYLIELAEKAMKANEVTPKICAIRGGTDGARLSFMGLPCPNLCTGGHNFHGRFEYIPVQSMEKICDILLTLVQEIETLKEQDK